MTARSLDKSLGGRNLFFNGIRRYIYIDIFMVTLNKYVLTVNSFIVIDTLNSDTSLNSKLVNTA
jgi:hypothetical protein